jgi:hypothetical protein
LQRPYGSLIPEETYSPVVLKDSLRLFLSVADVKAAFFTGTVIGAHLYASASRLLIS